MDTGDVTYWIRTPDRGGWWRIGPRVYVAWVRLMHLRPARCEGVAVLELPAAAVEA
jgi:hypothetical protein